jgi:hypothetical protein
MNPETPKIIRTIVPTRPAPSGPRAIAAAPATIIVMIVTKHVLSKAERP